jgi:hypothetical protein
MRFRTTTTQRIPATSTHSEHAALVAEHAEDERQHAAAIAAVRAEIARDDARRAEAQTLVDDIVAQQRALERDARELSHAYDMRTARRETRLRDLADPRIGDVLNWIARERELLPTKLQTYDIRGPISGMTGRRRMDTSSNHQALTLIGGALTRARERADALTYQTVPDVGATLEEIRRSVPSLDAAEARIRAGQAVA